MATKRKGLGCLLGGLDIVQTSQPVPPSLLHPPKRAACPRQHQPSTQRAHVPTVRRVPISRLLLSHHLLFPKQKSLWMSAIPMARPYTSYAHAVRTMLPTSLLLAATTPSRSSRSYAVPPSHPHSSHVLRLGRIFVQHHRELSHWLPYYCHSVVYSRLLAVLYR